jgi:hypothetical protein
MRLIVQRLLLAVALAVSAILIVPASAQAEVSQIEVCTSPDLFPCPTWVINIPDPWDPDDVCPPCNLTFDILKGYTDPAVFKQFDEYFSKGFILLADSRLAKDPALAKEMRWASVDYFVNAAKVIEKYDVGLETVGWFDPKAGKFFEHPESQASLDVFGKELAAGTRIFQASLGDPDPQPSFEEALSHFDSAIKALSKT